MGQKTINQTNKQTTLLFINYPVLWFVVEMSFHRHLFEYLVPTGGTVWGISKNHYDSGTS